MGKKGTKTETGGRKDNEGHNLLGSPSFDNIGSDRFRCVETGHELPGHSRDSYSLSKHCRLGLINVALAKNKPPLNMFRQDPQSCSKLICKLTGDVINKNEGHIWKHINGKRFLNMLERKEMELVEKRNEKGNKNGKIDKKAEADDSYKKMEKNKQEEAVERESSEVKEKGSDLEQDSDFWLPPVGDHWDNNDGGDRWGSDTEDSSGDEKEGDTNVDNHECALEFSKRKEPVSQETGGSRKKGKTKTTTERCVKLS